MPILKGPLLFRRECLLLIRSRTVLCFVLVSLGLSAISFHQAVSLYREASRTALQYPELARGMSPLDGILVPTAGGFYLALTLLFGLVAILPMSQEKAARTDIFALQWPVSKACTLFAKWLSVFVVALLGLFPIIATVFIWKALGGHLQWAETVTALTGYVLFAAVVGSLGLAVGAWSQNFGTAGLIILSLVIGSWVLEFVSVGGSSDYLRSLGKITLSSGLHEFETGLLAYGTIIRFLVLCLFGLSVTWLGFSSNLSLRRRFLPLLLIVLGLGIVYTFSGYVRASRDFSEDRRNSFPSEIESSFSKMSKELQITIYLTPDDSRFREYERKILSKLSRTVPKLSWSFGVLPKTGLFQNPQTDRYGIIDYKYDGERAESRSLSSTEILQTILDITEFKGMTVTTVLAEYPGYPWAKDLPSWVDFCYGVLAATFLGVWLYLQKPRRTKLCEQH